MEHWNPLHWQSYDGLRLTVDLLLVAFIIYRVMLLINRTRAVQLLIGAGVILLVDLLARQLELMTLSWLITNVSSYLVFALIVLLQPELRRLVSEIGQMPVFQWLNRQHVTPLDPIVEALAIMAREKTGALICILQEIKPQTIIENAVRLNSDISSEILLTIFHKDTALHDGAVLIDADRILAASCYLPLSNNLNVLRKTHGARHRAALGMSEESDAVVLVSSEETGKISVLFQGEMVTGVKQQECRDIVHKILTGKIRHLGELDIPRNPTTPRKPAENLNKNSKRSSP
ncbi:MAG: diadenylate cyclase CdaA [Leptospiraceae bacterium]|nr:diadenylate cyclase CdaA [Leptospiraceae bacterium]